MRNQSQEGENPEISTRMDGHKIKTADIKKAMVKMKSGKATGRDGIEFELINALGSFGVKKIAEIVNQASTLGDIPDEMLESIVIAIPKKSGTIECKNHQTISVMSHISKVILRVELERVKGPIRKNLSDEQFGYCPGKGTGNAFLCLRTLTEKCIEKQKDMYICFVDYVRAFDCVKLELLLEMLEELEIDWLGLRLIRNLYRDRKAAIRIQGELGN